MKLYLLFTLSWLSFQLSGQDFYDISSIQTIEITFAESNWDALLDAQKAGDENYILAQSIVINGESFDSIGVKYKGNSTYQPNQVKNPFHIELDTYKDHNYQGYKDIKLSNIAKDPSFIREVLSYQILGQYMDAPKSNYANVYVNGTLIGLYSNSEAISKTFIKDRFGSKNNTFIKCNPPEGAGPQSNDFPNLVYLSQDSSDYYDAYEIKSENGWQDLINLCDTLSNQTEALDQILDIDRTLWMLAFNNVLVNLDSYSGRFAQNYYLYKDDTNRFLPVVWDLNESFGRFSDAGSGQLNNTAAKQSMDIFLHENDPDFPLIQKLLSNDTYRRMYLAHCKTILLENFDNDAYYDNAVILKSIIDEAVQADNNKLFSYANFQSNLDSDINGGGGGPGGGATPGIKSLMEGRSDYLLSTSALTATEPTISNPSLSSNTPFIGDEVTILATITDGDNVILGYRNDDEQAFIKVEMFDDGNHNDEAAGDGIYGTTVQLTDQITQYFIYAENDNIGLFSPRRAEYEYHIILADPLTLIESDLVINEFMASNDNTLADQDGEFDDWIELYNNGDSEIDLTNYSLTDDNTDINQWTFPDGTIIGPREYLLIWADNDEEQDGLHTNFKLSASGETVSLWNADEVRLDEVAFPDQNTDISYGRFPNGTGDFQFMLNTTPNAKNDGTTSTNSIDISNNNIKIYPNPSNGLVTLKTNSNNKTSFSIYNLSGQLMIQSSFNGSENLDITTWESGLYYLKNNESIYKIVKF